MLTFAALVLAAPFQAGEALLAPPPGWAGERLDFPLSFAPELELRGYEDLAFAPGMFAPESDSYFSYALALRLEGELEIDAAFLDSFLETYYRGLCRAVAAERGLELDLDSIEAKVTADGPGFRAKVALFDAFGTGAPLELALELESHAGPRTTELLGLASPLDVAAPIWNELHTIGERWRAKRPTPALLNHVFFVVDRPTYDALVGSEFLRTFAVTEERETVRADGSYTGFYIYGRHTYFEFVPPGAAGMTEGSTGLALGLEAVGATDALAQRLGEGGVRSQAFPITRALEQEALPWFRLLGMELPSPALTVFTMEYDAAFLARWHAGLAPSEGGLARADVLERYAAALGASELRASQALSDVAEVRLSLDDAQQERLLAVCAASGYELEEHGEERIVHAPGFRLVLSRALAPGGITGLELALCRPLVREPLELGKVVLRFHERGASLDWAARTDPWIVHAGGEGPGRGKRIVLVAGDEEYRSEEALPQLAAILAARHGFQCTVLLPVDPLSGVIEPEDSQHIPGLAALDTADMLVLFTRFRRLADEDMAHIARFVESGRPLLGIRTATHAFAYESGDASPYAQWSWDSAVWPGGFGRQVLGETWVAHHGAHGSESTRGVIVAGAAGHPMLRGVTDVWGPTDVYAVGALPPDAEVLLEGAVLAGMRPDALPVTDGRNAPRMPLVWTRERELSSGAKQRVIATTIGAATDLECEDLRRLFVNACYWGLGLEGRIPARSAAELVGVYAPSPFGFGGHRRGLRPSDLTQRSAGSDKR